MGIIQIVGLGIVATILSVVIKSYRPEMALQISIIAGILIFALVAVNLSTVIKMLEQTASKAGMDFTYLAVIVKIIGIAYISQFGAEICKDAGETAIASKIEFAGKILIALITAPIVFGFINTVIQIIP
jgi:stage III sporulation protein AD